MEKRNISTYRTQRANEENDVIQLVMVIIMSKTAHLMYFLLNTEESRPSWARYLNEKHRSIVSASDGVLFQLWLGKLDTIMTCHT